MRPVVCRVKSVNSQNVNSMTAVFIVFNHFGGRSAILPILQLEAVFVYELLDQPMIAGATCGTLEGSICEEGHYGLLEVDMPGKSVGAKKPTWGAVHTFAQGSQAIL